MYPKKYPGRGVLPPLIIWRADNGRRQEIRKKSGEKSRWVDIAVDIWAESEQRESLEPLRRKGSRRVDIG